MIQRVLFTGRFQCEYAALDADQGEVSEWNVRRLRFGPRITFFRKFLFHTEIEVNPQETDPFYVRMTVPFTLEGATSSRELITIDRSSIGTNIWSQRSTCRG